MKMYLASLGAGLLVGFIYALLDVRSPAPPAVALLGLFGMLLGEQIPPLAKRLLAGHGFSASVQAEHCGSHIFGRLPGRYAERNKTQTVERTIQRDS
jgi:XapX domain-containing protein